MVIDTVQKIKNGVGISTLSMILQGSRNKKLDPYMKSLNSYGKYGHLKICKIKDNVKEIQKDGLIREHNVQYGWGTYFKVSDKGKKWYYNQGKNVRKAIKKISEFVDLLKFKLSLHKFEYDDKFKNIKSKKNLKQFLLDWRKKKANEMNLPQYCILKNNVIDNIIHKMPKNINELVNVKGIGKKIIEKYGKEIMHIISFTPLGNLK
jgi:ATP-dependent DNA helicase RecQ